MEETVVKTLEQLEEEYTRNKEDVELTENYALALIEELVYSLGPSERGSFKYQKLINRLSAVTSGLEKGWHYDYANAFLSFVKDDRKGFLEHMESMADTSEPNSQSLGCDDFVVLFVHPLNPAFPGMYSALAGFLKKAWPDSAAVHTLQGFEKLFFEKAEDAAVDCFSSALGRDSTYWVTSEHLGNIYYGREIWKSAVAFYEQALQNESIIMDKASIYFDLGWAYGKLKMYGEEEKAYHECLKLTPDFQYARNNLGLSLYMQKKYEEALDHFEIAIVDGNDGRYPYWNKFRALKRLKRTKEAVLFMEQCISSKKLPESYRKQIDAIDKKMTQKGLPPNKVPHKATEGNTSDCPSHNVDPIFDTESPRRASTTSAMTTEKHLEEEIESRILCGQVVFGKKLRMYDKEQYGRQYAVADVGRIDLLAIDSDSGDLVVVELKRDQSDDETVGQISRYMAWVKKNLCSDAQKVHGIICVNLASHKLRLSASMVPNLEVFEYEVRFGKV